MTTIDRTFTAGQIVATPGALDAFARNITGPGYFHLLARHLSGDWGDVCSDDAQANEEALRDGYRLLSSYRLADGTRVWFITEADRSATTALLPEEY
jgi:hypothetical protein